MKLPPGAQASTAEANSVGEKSRQDLMMESFLENCEALTAIVVSLSNRKERGTTAIKCELVLPLLYDHDKNYKKH